MEGGNINSVFLADFKGNCVSFTKMIHKYLDSPSYLSYNDFSHKPHSYSQKFQNCENAQRIFLFFK